MKRTFLTLLTIVLAAGTAQAELVSFNDFNNAASLTGIATANGSIADLTVTRATEGAAGNLDYRFSVSYTGSDFDGDLNNDTLSFDLLVSALGASTVTSTTEPGPEGQNYTGAVTLGTNRDATLNGSSGQSTFSVGNALFNPGETLVFSIENASLGTLSGFNIDVLGFDTFRMNETGASNSHQTITGLGTGLFLADANANRTISLTSADPDEGGSVGFQDILYVSSKNPTGGGGNPQRFGIDEVGFDIEVTQAVPEPSSIALFGLGVIGLVSRRKRR